MKRPFARWIPALLLCTVAGAAWASDHAPTVGSYRLTTVQDDSVRYAVRVTDNNLMGVTITNYGFVGNNFISRSPSLEYPLGLGYEHLVRGGLWFGARAVDAQGEFIGVVTGAVDGNQGTASQSASEYTPAGRQITSLSSLPNSKYFNPAARSELDLISDFSDQPGRTASGTGEDHRPMGIVVHQENYMWSFSDYKNVVFFHLKITNNGSLPLADAWVGLYGEFASGNKNAYSTWPPTNGGSPTGGWYRKKWIAYDDSLRLFREHYCQALPIPGGCHLEEAPFWVGLSLLGVRPGSLADTADKKVTLAAWDYAPGSVDRDEDTERYALLSAGTIASLSNPILQPESGDPVTMLAVGPFPEIDPGTSIEVDFALVGGVTEDDIRDHTLTAQRAYERNYIVPVPPPSPRFKVVARDHALDLYWDNSSESASDPTSPNPIDFEGYRVYVGEDRLELNRVGQFDKNTAPNDTTGFNTGFDAVTLNPPVVIDGVTYQYRYTVSNLRDGFKYYGAVTAFDLGNVEIESLESGISQNKTLSIPSPAPGQASSDKVVVFPNPYRVEARWDAGKSVRDHYLWFANLPQRCHLQIYTLAGDLVFETEFDGATYQGAGTRGIYDPQRELDVPPPTLSGASYGWDMITSQGQAAATGLYMFAVEDRTSGKRSVGKFLIVKSDREGF